MLIEKQFIKKIVYHLENRYEKCRKRIALTFTMHRNDSRKYSKRWICRSSNRTSRNRHNAKAPIYRKKLTAISKFRHSSA